MFVKAPKTLLHPNQPIKRAMNHNKNTFSKCKKCKCTHYWDHFARAKNKLRQLTRHFISDYEHNMALNIKDNSKRFWRYVSTKDKSRQTLSFLKEKSWKIWKTLNIF